MPPTRIYVYFSDFLAILVEFSLDNGMLCGNVGQNTVKIR